MPNSIGIDLGATKTLAVRVSPSGKVEERLLFPTPQSRAAAVDALADAAVSLRTGGTLGIGIGVAGPVDFEGQAIRTMPNLAGFDRFALGAAVGRKTGLPCRIDNDAKCFLRAEMAFGAAKGRRNALGLTIGTGIGGAVAINGEIYRGCDNYAGEFGHMVISGSEGNPNARVPCSLEALASGEAMRFLASRPVFSGASRRKNPVDAKELFALAGKGDRAALQTVDAVAFFLGTGLANLVNAFNPEIIVLGGSASKGFGLMHRRVHSRINELCFPPAREVPIAVSKLDFAGAAGAGLLINRACNNFD